MTSVDLFAIVVTSAEFVNVRSLSIVVPSEEPSLPVNVATSMVVAFIVVSLVVATLCILDTVELCSNTSVPSEEETSFTLMLLQFRIPEELIFSTLALVPYDRFNFPLLAPVPPLNSFAFIVVALRFVADTLLMSALVETLSSAGLEVSVLVTLRVLTWFHFFFSSSVKVILSLFTFKFVAERLAMVASLLILNVAVPALTVPTVAVCLTVRFAAPSLRFSIALNFLISACSVILNVAFDASTVLTFAELLTVKVPPTFMFPIVEVSFTIGFPA